MSFSLLLYENREILFLTVCSTVTFILLKNYATLAFVHLLSFYITLFSQGVLAHHPDDGHHHGLERFREKFRHEHHGYVYEHGHGEGEVDGKGDDGSDSISPVIGPITPNECPTSLVGGFREPVCPNPFC
jgi:hypothetical protein